MTNNNDNNNNQKSNNSQSFQLLVNNVDKLTDYIKELQHRVSKIEGILIAISVLLGSSGIATIVIGVVKILSSGI